MKTASQQVRSIAGTEAMTTHFQFKSASRSLQAFTLIELLVVIAVIAILAGMIFPITGAVNRQKMRSKARSELYQVATLIEAYKTKLGHYPPDNPVDPRINPLYYELAGTRLNQATFTTLDGASQITPAVATSTFGVGGFANSMQGAGGDEGRVATSFIRELKPGAVATLTSRAKILVCTIPWPQNNDYKPAGLPGLNPIRYRSSNLTNNPGSFEIWVDVLIGNKTNRISNWSREPLVVGDAL